MVYYGDNVSREQKEQSFFDCCSFVFIAKRVPVAFGINKLVIGCVIEDDKVKTFFSFHYFLLIYMFQIGIDFLEEKIYEFDEYVQSVDIVSFNKI